ncbi:MAG: hypothetical protein ABI867_00515 [Kofleriaceae bacterium]
MELTSNLRLLDTLAENLDDLGPWSVYGDLLQTEADPRGELITLMLERERQPSRRLLELQRRYLDKHAPELLPARDATSLTWWRGFVAELRIDAPDQLATAVADPALRFVDAATLVVDEASWSAWSRSGGIRDRRSWRTCSRSSKPHRCTCSPGLAADTCC